MLSGSSALINDLNAERAGRRALGRSTNRGGVTRSAEHEAGSRCLHEGDANSAQGLVLTVRLVGSCDVTRSDARPSL